MTLDVVLYKRLLSIIKVQDVGRDACAVTVDVT